MGSVNLSSHSRCPPWVTLVICGLWNKGQGRKVACRRKLGQAWEQTLAPRLYATTNLDNAKMRKRGGVEPRQSPMPLGQPLKLYETGLRRCFILRDRSGSEIEGCRAKTGQPPRTDAQGTRTSDRANAWHQSPSSSTEHGRFAEAWHRRWMPGVAPPVFAVTLAVT